MRKKSPAKSLAAFQKELAEIRRFLKDVADKGVSAVSLSHSYDFGIIWTYRAFEIFVLDILVAQINHDPSKLYDEIGVNFGTNPTAAQSEYLLVGDRYFDFRGHGGLVTSIKKAAGDGSQLENAAKNQAHRKAFEILVGLRNYAAHWSEQSKTAALKAMQHWEPDRQNLGRAGNWLSAVITGRTRMERLLSSIEALCIDMADAV
jgi:hypothetical protein